MSETKTPATILESHLGPDNAQDVVELYNEGVRIDDPVARQEHVETVAELVGEMATDIRLAEIITDHAERDRKIIEEEARQIRARHAVKEGEAIARQGYVELTPLFTDQVTDESRTNTFKYAKRGQHRKPEQRWVDTSTEAEGLQQLYSFLADFINASRQSDGTYILPKQVESAKSIIDKLSFIGREEYQNGTFALAAYWKQYLDEDPNRVICALAPISYSENFPDKRKSDDYLRDQILNTFSDEELEKYSGRIVGSIDDLDADPENTKVIVLDDWSLSGGEMRKAYVELTASKQFRKYDAAGVVEANMLVASERQLQRGIKIEESTKSQKRLPVRACYKARYAADAVYAQKAHISGTHSAANYDFEHPVKNDILRQGNRTQLLNGRYERPSLVNIVPDYYTADREVLISKTALKRVGKADEYVN